MKKLIAFLICISLFLTGCGNSGFWSASSQKPASPTAAETAPTTVATETSPEAVTEASTETDGTQEESTSGGLSVSAETAAALIESTLKDSFENVSVTCDGSTIVIDIWQTGIAYGVSEAVSGNSECIESWNTLVENMTGLSSAALEMAKTIGVQDASILLNIKNDLNTENALLTIFNDTVIYDAVNSK